MSDDSDDDKRGRDERPRHMSTNETTQPFAREDELRRQEPLGGCDVENCQRMRE